MRSNEGKLYGTGHLFAETRAIVRISGRGPGKERHCRAIFLGNKEEVQNGKKSCLS